MKKSILVLWKPYMAQDREPYIEISVPVKMEAEYYGEKFAVHRRIVPGPDKRGAVGDAGWAVSHIRTGMTAGVTDEKTVSRALEMQNAQLAKRGPDGLSKAIAFCIGKYGERNQDYFK